MSETITHVKIPYKPRRWAKPFHAFLGRNSVLVTHRRMGKTTAILNHLQRAAWDDDWETTRLRFLMPSLTAQDLTDRLRGRYYGHIFPFRREAKETAWEYLKYFARPIPGVKPNEAELLITYPPTDRNPIGSRLQLFGADDPEGLRGPGFSGLAFDEYGLHPPHIFSEVLSKSLADHLGFAIFAGTIKGKNQLWQTYQAAKGDPAWFTLWQDIDQSLATEDDASTRFLRQAMEDEKALITKGLMSQAEFDQEWYLSTEAAIKGAYYGELIAQLRRTGRIGAVSYDQALKVDTDWDLGINDEMAIWFSQSLRSGEVRLIDYYEATGQGLAHYVQVLQQKGYIYGQHWAPHDIRVRELGTGKSRLEVAKELGISFQIVPDIGVMDGIDAVRRLLPRCWFDERKCEMGLEALTQYRRGYNERMQQFTDAPVHNFASHGADAFRGLAVRHKTPEEKPKRGNVYTGGPMTQAPSGLGWLA